MTDRPIIFSAPMVRALSDGRKTQTRRILTRQNTDVNGESWRGKSYPWEGLRFDEARARNASPISGYRDSHLAVPFSHPQDPPTPTDECGFYRVRPLVQIGDRLWVRETFSGKHDYDEQKWPPRAWFTGDAIWYWADGNPTCGDWTKPKPGIHMPRWASRLTLTVTDVRVERLQSISRGDAIAEGIERVGSSVLRWENWSSGIEGRTERTPEAAYALLWERINGAGSWAANPWVVAVSFTVERRNIDAGPS